MRVPPADLRVELFLGRRLASPQYPRLERARARPLVVTVPQGWNVVLHFKNQDPKLPHSVEVIPDGAALPSGPVPPAFEHATTGRLDQGFGAGQGGDVRFVAGKAGAFVIFCAVPGHGAAGMWIRLAVSPPPIS